MNRQVSLLAEWNTFLTVCWASFSPPGAWRFWQMPLIVPLLEPEGRYCYPQILFLWIKKPQHIQHFPTVILWFNNWNHFVLLWTLSNSFSFLFRCGGQKCKPSLEKKGCFIGSFISLSLSLAPPCLNSRQALDSFHLLSIVVPMGFYSICCRSLILLYLGFCLFWLQSNSLYLKPIKLHPLILCFVEFKVNLTLCIVDF